MNDYRRKGTETRKRQGAKSGGSTHNVRNRILGSAAVPHHPIRATRGPWLEVKRYCIGPPDARIEGLVGFVGRGPASKTYKFILVLPQQVESLDALDWQSLLPDPESPGWVKIEEGLITINAAAT